MKQRGNRMRWNRLMSDRMKKIAKGVARGIKKLQNDTRGVTTVEVILVLVVLLAIVVIFREQLTAIVTGIFSHVNSTVNELYG